MTGVTPRGAQVRRTTGSSDTPDSSQNTMTALRRLAFFPDPWPVSLHPPGDRLLVAFDGAAGGALQPPAQPAAQQLPHVTGMVGHPGHLLDHAGDPGESPVVGVEPVRAGALPERLPDSSKLRVGQARGVPGRAGAAQRLQPARAPLGVPAAGVLPGDTELAGDLGLGAAGGEQRAGLQTDSFERLAVAQTTGVAAVGGWSHPAMLPGQPLIVSPEGAKLFFRGHSRSRGWVVVRRRRIARKRPGDRPLRCWDGVGYETTQPTPTAGRAAAARGAVAVHPIFAATTVRRRCVLHCPG